MDDSVFASYIENLSVQQASTVALIRAIVTANAPQLRESVNAGRWLSNYLFYSADASMIYAIGPKAANKTAFHMMPYYGSALLQEKHGEQLGPYLTGKSCVTFANPEQVPIAALEDIVASGTQPMIELTKSR